jgi:DNA-directed RNA polymerase specialized sigma24 family protein
MTEQTNSSLDDARFKRELTSVIPHLRAFARGLCGRPDYADDLVQDAMLKAWAVRDPAQPVSD